jgi:gliding motility-associated-like protein
VDNVKRSASSPYKLPVQAPQTNIVINKIGYSTIPFCYNTVNDNIVIKTLDSPSLVSKTETCNANNDQYVVIVTLTGGDAGSYQFDPATRIPAGLVWTFDGIDTWTSDPITSGVAYEVDFFDGNNCDIEKVSGQKTCACTSTSGTVDITPMDICEDASTEVTYDGSSEILDGNDILEFILHDGVGPDPIGTTILDQNNTGVFAYQVGYAYNTQYYITAVAGNNNAGQVDLNDPCLSTSANIPVTFRQLPTMTMVALPNDSICIGDMVELEFTFPTGVAPYAINGTGGSLFNLSDGHKEPVNPSVTTIYAFTTISDAYCSNTINEQVKITLPQPFDVTPAQTAISCHDSFDGVLSVVVTGGYGNYTYQWYDDTPAPISAQTNNNITNLGPGDYSVIISDAIGCNYTEYFTLNKPPLFDIDLVEVFKEICFQDSAGFIKVVAQQADSFQLAYPVFRDWQKEGIFIDMHYLPGSNDYEIIATDSNGCIADTIIDIIGLTPIVWVNAPEDRYLCPNTPTELEGAVTGGNSGAYTYFWDSIPGGSTHIVNPPATTTYEVYAKDARGCPSTNHFVTVSIPDPLTAQTTHPNSMCFGDEDMLNAFPLGGAGSYQYQWLNTVNRDTHTESIWSIMPDTTTSYQIKVTDSCGTEFTKAVQVIVPEPIAVTFDLSSNDGCAPLTATFTNTTTSGYKTRQWNFGNGSSTNNNPTYKWLRTGQYITSLTLIDQYDCEYKSTDTVNVHPNTTALFSFFPEKINAAIPEVQLRNHSQLADSYTWTIDSLGTSPDEEPIITFPAYESGSYKICLLANNEYNCPDELCKYISAENENLVFVPNFFTPNGDNLNEGFKPVLSSDKINHYEFMVFDRWGELLFSTGNQELAWDGTFKDNPVKPDTYTWKLQVRFTGEVTIRKHSGIITLGK